MTSFRKPKKPLSPTAHLFFFTPINEISISSYAAGENAIFSPYCKGRGLEFKAQFVLAAIAATEAIRPVVPDARFLTVDPIINVLHDPRRPNQRAQAEAYLPGLSTGLWKDRLPLPLTPLLQRGASLSRRARRAPEHQSTLPVAVRVGRCSPK